MVEAFQKEKTTMIAPDGSRWGSLDFAAKVRWRMLYDRNPLHPLLLDKVAVKEFAAARGVASARSIHVTADPEDIPFGDLPPNCFLKANHASAWNYLRHEGEWYFFGYGAKLMNFDGTLVPEKERSPFLIEERGLLDQCREMLLSRYSKLEWAYHRISPRIVIEELLQPIKGGELMDYRFYTFDGMVAAISVGSPCYRREERNVFLTPEWEVIPLSSYLEALPEQIPERPAMLKELIEAAGRLGEGIDFARIDLYETAQGIRLGEMTLYPEGGDRNTPTSCPRFNHWLGSFWKAPGYSSGSSDRGVGSTMGFLSP
jgi:hypothetical protein